MAHAAHAAKEGGRNSSMHCSWRYIRTCKLALMRGSSRPLSRAEAETRERKVLAGEGACSAQMLCAS